MTRHILGLSGGKDSTALAIHIKDTRPEIFDKLELYFTDTGRELKETYTYLNKIERYLGKKIHRIKATTTDENGFNETGFKVADKYDKSIPMD